MHDRSQLLICWEADETNSWNPVLARALRRSGHEVAEAHHLRSLRVLQPQSFDICLPRFRVRAAHMACVDEVLVRSGIAMLNSRECRQRCENKALAHLAFEANGIPQPASFVFGSEGIRDRELSWSGRTVLKPLSGSRGDGIEIFDSLERGLARAAERRQDLLVQQLIWPARCWRVIVGRNVGAVDPYWRRPPHESDRVLSISAGSTIVRDPPPPAVEEVAIAMLEAVGGDLLAADVLETAEGAYALEMNHNFDAHGGTRPAVAAFEQEIRAKIGRPSR